MFIESFYTNWPKRVYVYYAANTAETTILPPNYKYYRVLGVQVNANLCTIRQAYRSLVLQTHPDKGGSKDQFLKIQEAYEVLTRPSI
jgi:preprotein translocase subunit Sec63